MSLRRSVNWRKDAADIRHEAHSLKPPAPTGDQGQDEGSDRSIRGPKPKWANQSENATGFRKRSPFRRVRSPNYMFRCDFDRDSHLLNRANGVVDLRVRLFDAPDDRKYMMSSLCALDFRTERHSSSMGNSLAAFTSTHADHLESVGLGTPSRAIRGRTRIILHGPGNAGKGTFMDWLTNALGPDYACARAPIPF